MGFSRPNSLETTDQMTKKKTTTKATTEPPKVYTAKDVAAIRKCSQRVVQRWAAEYDLGTLYGTTKVFTEAEKDRLVELIIGKPGNPNMGTKNAPKRKPKTS
jgi:hypothetical protein